MSDLGQGERRKRKKYYYEGIALENPCCPNCHKEISTLGVESCSFCCFTFVPLTCSEKFESLPLDPIMDESGVFSSEQRESFLKAIQVIEDKFPEFKFCLCVKSFEEEIDFRTAGFYLFNGTASRARSALKTCLLLFDPKSRKLSVTIGYQIEAYLDANQLKEALGEFYEAMCEKRFDKARLLLSVEMVKVLGQSKKRTERKTSKGRKLFKS